MAVRMFIETIENNVPVRLCPSCNRPHPASFVACPSCGRQRLAPTHERPLAAPGLVSYRCRSPYGWIMIGARDHDDAMREALRSSDTAKRDDLEIWDGTRYVSC